MRTMKEIVPRLTQGESCFAFFVSRDFLFLMVRSDHGDLRLRHRLASEENSTAPGVARNNIKDQSRLGFTSRSMMPSGIEVRLASRPLTALHDREGSLRLNALVRFGAHEKKVIHFLLHFKGRRLTIVTR